MSISGRPKIAEFKVKSDVLEANRDVKGLIRVFDYKDFVMLRIAAGALGRIGEPAVEPLIATLKDKEWWMRWGAAWALCMIEEPAVKPLIAALKDKNEDVQRGAAWALDTISNYERLKLLPPIESPFRTRTL